MSEVADKVKKIIAEHLGIDDMEKITVDAKFIDDLGADSLDTVELVMAFEEAFDVEIPDEKAEKILLGSIKENPKSQLAHFNLAKVYSEQNKLDQALEAFAKSLKVNPQFLEPYYESAQIYLKQNDKGSAMAQLKKALEEGATEPKFKDLLSKITA